MEMILTYAAKVSLATMAMFILYRLLFRHQKQFHFNRIFLIFSMMIGFLIPLITITLTRVQVSQPAGLLPLPESSLSFEGNDPDNRNNLIRLFLYAYFAGAGYFLLRLIAGNLKAYHIVDHCRKISICKSTVYITEQDIHPFTFFDKVVMPQETISHPDLPVILAHEVVHARGRHTIDILVSEFLFLLQWFNPFAWLLKDAIRSNLEFIADEKAAKQTEMQTYLMALVTWAGQKRVTPFLTALNGNDLKNRIIMMKKSSKTCYSLLRKMSLFPVIFLLVAVLSAKNYQTVVPGIPQIAVKGSVISAGSGKSIPGAMVLIKGSSTGTITDDHGNYSILLNGNTDTLLFVAANYITVEIPVKGGKVIDVALKAIKPEGTKERQGKLKKQTGNASRTDEVTVTGYGIQKPEKTNGNSGEVKSLGHPIQVIGEPLPAFQQKKPEAVDSIKIRNVVNEPPKDVLYIVDGQEMKKIDDISPEEIESVSVLKGETATALYGDKYGDKAKNGIIRITTKKSQKPGGDPLIILDGKETSKKVSDINPEEIESVSVWKGESAITRYGEKGKNGVIEIKMKNPQK